MRNYLLYDHPQKAVVSSPFECATHIGCATERMTLDRAKYLCNIMVGKVDTSVYNVDNPYMIGHIRVRARVSDRSYLVS